MAKVKMTLKSSAGARKKTASSSSRKPKNSTPTKVARGKIGKPPRPNIKGESTSSSLSLDLNKYYEIQSQTRLCFVNIKRDTSIFNSSVNKSSSVTLQAQCTDTSAVGCNKENTVETEIHSEKSSGDTTAARQAIPNSEQRQRNVVNESKSTKNKNVSENIKEVSSATPPNAANALRRCNIKVKRTALNVVAQNESTAQDKEKIIAEKIPPSPTGAKNCLVKLYKLPMVPKSTPAAEELYAIAEKQDEILASSLSQIENPVVDQEKRKAFLKLALPKSKNGKFAAGENSHDENDSDITDNVEKVSKNTVPRTMELPETNNIKDLNMDKISQNKDLNNSTKATDLTKTRKILSLNSVRSVRDIRNKATANENQLSEINKNKKHINNSSQNMENIPISSKTSESTRIGNSAVNSVSALQNIRNEAVAKENELPKMNKSNDLNLDIISKSPEILTNSKTRESTKGSNKLPINSVIAFKNNTIEKSSAKAKELPEMNKSADLDVNSISNNTSKTNSLNSVRILNTGRKAPAKEKELQKTNKNEDIIVNNKSNSTEKLIASKTNSLKSVRTLNTRSKVPAKAKELQEMNKSEDLIVNNISNKTEKMITSKTNSLNSVRTLNTRSKVPAKAKELQEMNNSEDLIVNNISNKTEKIITSKTNSLNSVRILNTRSKVPAKAKELHEMNKSEDLIVNISNKTEKIITSKTNSLNSVRTSNTRSKSPPAKAKELPEMNKSKDIIVNNMSNNTEKLITSKTNSLNSVRTLNTRSKAPAKAKELPVLNKYKSDDISSNAKKLLTSKTNSLRTLNTKSNAPAKTKELPETNKSKDTNAKISENKEETNSYETTEAKESSKNKALNSIPNLKNTLIKTAVKAKQLPMSNKIVDPKRIHFVPQKNSTMHFEHFSNSKELELFNDREEEDNINNNSNNNKNNNDQEKENANQINPPKSIVNKTTTTPNKNNKIHRFFHRNNDKISTQTPQKKIRTLLSVKIMSPLSQKNRFLSKRSSQIKREHVYDFLSQSQSQTSDSEGNSGKIGPKPVDPMADVIKRLIEQGKVTVATKRRGKGRPKLKPNKPLKRNVNRVTKKKGSEKPKKGEKTTAKKVMTLPPPIAEEGNMAKDDDDHHHDYDNNLDNFEHFMDGDNDDNVDYNMNKPSNQQALKKFAHHQMVSEQEGTFSNLAKSVLINQAGRSDAQRIKAQRLLAMARKIISTPKNNKNVPSLQASVDLDFSPIHPPMPNKRPPTKPSPWRVDEDAHLPRVFNFSRSSSNLPSFSSDFIPPTPRKETPKNKTLSASNATPTVEQHAQSSPMPSIMQSMAALPANQVSTPLVNNQNFSVPSSFSSNDSNAENQPPPKAGPPDKSPNENANIFDLKQLPNPRRTLTYRSPLKAINILEVVHLPPIANLKAAHAAKEKETETNQMEMFGFEELAANDTTFKSPQKPKTPSNKKSKRRLSPEKDLFGFEEFLTQTDASSQESQIEQSRVVSPNNTIHDKLQGLRRLRPASAELQFNLQQTNIPQKVPNLFNDPAHIAKPQKTIQQMLCSTMIEKPSTSKRALEELNRRNLQKPREAFNGANNVNSNISELFKDPEPETTFNEEDPHRTYIRPYKRKRRLRENKLVFVYDSDESWDGDNSSPKKKKRGAKHQNHQHSHETDTSSEQKGNKRKRQCKEKPELKNFVEEFQEMCKEVDSYELIVEKSA